MTNENFLFAFSLTFLAGFSTFIGSLLSFTIKKENFAALALGLGFSAGVMIYVSFMEILPQSQLAFLKILNEKSASIAVIASFFTGILLTAIIDRFIPDHIEPSIIKCKDCEEPDKNLERRYRLKRVGIFTAIALGIHNFPEGLATFIAGLTDKTLGVSIAIAIAIHNIPEGISVALPIYHATGSRFKAVWYSFLSGMAEPLGALIGFFLLSFLFNSFTFGILFALVAGIMIYISFDELLPTAREYEEGHLEISGVIAGMFVMAVSLLLFK